MRCRRSTAPRAAAPIVGLNIGADLAGTEHFGGPANETANGEYYIMNMAASDLGHSAGRATGSTGMRLCMGRGLRLEPGLRLVAGLHLEPGLHLDQQLHLGTQDYTWAQGRHLGQGLHLEQLGALVEHAPAGSGTRPRRRRSRPGCPTSSR